MASKLNNSSVSLVLRVKRKRIEEPVEALVVATKRAKLNPTLPEKEDQKVFHFAGTIENHHQSTEEILAHVSKHKPSSVKLSSFSNLTISGQQDDRRRARKELTSSQRFKLISEHRSMQEDTSNESSTSQNTKESETQNKTFLSRIGHVYDLEQESTVSSSENCSSVSSNSELMPVDSSKGNCVSNSMEPSNESTITCNSSPMVREVSQCSDENSEYVYDLYYTQSSNIKEMMPCNWTSIHGRLYDMELVHDIIDTEEDEYHEEEDDSNDEGNWRNDYPDELSSSYNSNSSNENLPRYKYGDYADDSDDGGENYY